MDNINNSNLKEFDKIFNEFLYDYRSMMDLIRVMSRYDLDLEIQSLVGTLRVLDNSLGAKLETLEEMSWEWDH